MTTTPPGPPLVSVIVPAYNHAPFIASTLDSVLEDGYRRTELLVLDDGSQDATANVARIWGERYKDQLDSFRLWTQENSGICATLNRLIEASRGDFIVILASDDRLVPGSIEHRVGALHSRPDWLAIFGESQVIDGDGRVLYERCFGAHKPTDRFALAHPNLRSWEIILRWPLCGSITAYRRQAFDGVEGVGPYDESRPTEDRDMYLRLLSRDALGYTDHVVCQYRLHGTNTMKSDAARRNAIAAAADSDKVNAPRFRLAKRMVLHVTAALRRSRLRGSAAPGFRGLATKVERIVLTKAMKTLLRWHDRRIVQAKAAASP